MIKTLLITATSLVILAGCSTTNEPSRYGFSNISPKREMLGNCLKRYGIQYYKETGAELVYLQGVTVFDYCRTLSERADFGIAG